MINATELLDARVFDAQGHYVGRVGELCILPVEGPERIGRLVIARGNFQPLVARYDQITEVEPGRIVLGANELELARFQPDDSWLTVRKDLLDQQIIDIHGRKVVRVNDVVMLDLGVNSHRELRIVQVDVGLAGAVHRLLKGILSPKMIRSFEKRLPTRVIPWEFVDMIETDPMRRVKLKLPQSRLSELHPADIADIIEELAPPEREAVLQTLDDTTAAEAIGEVKDDLQARILEELDKERVADILEQMPPDEAADVLAELSAKTAADVLQDMDRKEATELEGLLQFEEDTAGGLMTPDAFTCDENARVDEAVARLRNWQEPVEGVDTLYLVNLSGVLTGAVPLTKLLLAPGSDPVASLRNETLIHADTGAAEKEVFDLFDKYNLRSLPVVSSDQKLAGVVTVDDVVHRLWQQHK